MSRAFPPQLSRHSVRYEQNVDRERPRLRSDVVVGGKRRGLLGIVVFALERHMRYGGRRDGDIGLARSVFGGGFFFKYAFSPRFRFTRETREFESFFSRAQRAVSRAK